MGAHMNYYFCVIFLILPLKIFNFLALIHTLDYSIFSYFFFNDKQVCIHGKTKNEASQPPTLSPKF